MLTLNKFRFSLLTCTTFDCRVDEESLIAAGNIHDLTYVGCHKNTYVSTHGISSNERTK